MSREVIQDFLNSAGVVGISLTNRRMRPYFYGLDAVLDRTKQALGQGVLQVIENVPEGFESFEFYFAGHIVFIYKLTHGLVLLILTDRDLKLVEYSRGIAKIKYLIETDTYNTVAHFKLLLGSITQHSLPNSNWNANTPKANAQATVQNEAAKQRLINPIPDSKPETPSGSSSTSANERSRTERQSNLANIRASTTTASNANIRASATASNANGQTQPNINKPPASTTTAPTAMAVATNKSIQITSPTKLVSAKNDSQEYKLDELLVALNKLSHFTTQYLGKVVVTNYWKSSRPTSSWLAEFEVDRNGQISHPNEATISCEPEQIQQIKSWVAVYIKRCKQVIRNFDQMLDQDCLDSRQRQILL
jgi:hypothetical protein